MVGGIGAVDAAFGGVLVLSVILGLVRGLVFEMLSVLAWIAAYFVAQSLAPVLRPHLPVGEAGSSLNHAAAFGIVFVAALIVWSLAARLLRHLIRATPLSVIDRVLGAGFGLARGLLLLVAVVTVCSYTPAWHSDTWQRSQAVAWLLPVLHGLKPMLPDDLSQHLPA